MLGEVHDAIIVVARVATKMSAIPQTTPSRVIYSSVSMLWRSFDRRERIGTNESLLNQATEALATASSTIHASNDVFATGTHALADLGIIHSPR
jgi:ethanolamine ammonia-lyase large subunit